MLVVHEAIRVVGFYGLAPDCSCSRTIAPSDPHKDNHRIRFPAFFSVNSQQIANGWDGVLARVYASTLYSAAFEAAALIGGRALMVNAIDEESC